MIPFVLVINGAAVTRSCLPVWSGPVSHPKTRHAVAKWDNPSTKLLWENRPGHKIRMSNKNRFIPSGKMTVLSGQWQTVGPPGLMGKPNVSRTLFTCEASPHGISPNNHPHASGWNDKNEMSHSTIKGCLCWELRKQSANIWLGCKSCRFHWWDTLKPVHNRRGGQSEESGCKNVLQERLFLWIKGLAFKMALLDCALATEVSYQVAVKPTGSRRRSSTLHARKQVTTGIR